VNEEITLEVAREAILVTLQVAAPLMLIAMVVGIVIALFQAMTQIQEMTITFVPKIVVIFIGMLVLLPFMLRTLTTFTERMMDRIISLG
jgi:flagellar biosynthetic protein FliQ